MEKEKKEFVAFISKIAISETNNLLRQDQQVSARLKKRIHQLTKEMKRQKARNDELSEKYDTYKKTIVLQYEEKEKTLVSAFQAQQNLIKRLYTQIDELKEQIVNRKGETAQ